MARWTIVAACWLVMLTAGSLQAQEFIYPAHGQTPAMQQQDQYQCSQWATQQTGFNPSTLPPVARNNVLPPVGLFGVFRRHRYEEEQQQNAEQQQAYANGRASYSRAMNVCLTGRGYTVD